MTTLKPKVGDRVTVSFEGEVASVLDCRVLVLSTGNDEVWSNYVLPEHITAIHPHPLKVRDRVRIKGEPGGPGEIVCIRHDQAWVDWSASRGIAMSTWNLSELEHFDE